MIHCDDVAVVHSSVDDSCIAVAVDFHCRLRIHQSVHYWCFAADLTTRIDSTMCLDARAVASAHATTIDAVTQVAAAVAAVDVAVYRLQSLVVDAAVDSDAVVDAN